MVRYEFRFDCDFDDAKGIRLQFMKDYRTVDGVEALSKFPHRQRREWAAMLLNKYRHQPKMTLTDVD